MGNPVLIGKVDPVVPEPLLTIQHVIEAYLEQIEAVLGKKYRLTLICTYEDSDLSDADIILTRTTKERVLQALDRTFPDGGH